VGATIEPNLCIRFGPNAEDGEIYGSSAIPLRYNSKENEECLWGGENGGPIESMGLHMGEGSKDLAIRQRLWRKLTTEEAGPRGCQLVDAQRTKVQESQKLEEKGGIVKLNSGRRRGGEIAFFLSRRG